MNLMIFFHSDDGKDDNISLFVILHAAGNPVWKKNVLDF